MNRPTCFGFCFGFCLWLLGVDFVLAIMAGPQTALLDILDERKEAADEDEGEFDQEEAPGEEDRDGPEEGGPHQEELCNLVHGTPVTGRGLGAGKER